MKRSAPLVRKTELKRSRVPLRRSAPGRDTKPKPRKRGLKRDSFPKTVREAAWERAGGRCDRCGINVRLEGGWWDRMELHHRVLRKQGGPDTLPNALVLCVGCHVPGVHAHRRVAEDQGHIVRSHRDPATVPVLLYTGTWVLPDDGAWRPTTPPEGDTP